MTSRAAVTVSTVTDDADTASYTTNTTIEDTDVVAMENHNTPTNNFFTNPKDDGIMMGHDIIMANVDNKHCVPSIIDTSGTTMTATVMAVSDGVSGRERERLGHDEEYEYDPLERHVKLGGAPSHAFTTTTTTTTTYPPPLTTTTDLFPSHASVEEATRSVQDPFGSKEREEEEEFQDEEDVVLVPMKNSWTSSALQAFSSVMGTATSTMTARNQDYILDEAIPPGTNGVIVADTADTFDDELPFHHTSFATTTSSNFGQSMKDNKNSNNSTPAFAMMATEATMKSTGKERMTEKDGHYYQYEDEFLLHDDEEKKDEYLTGVDNEDEEAEEDVFDDEIVTNKNRKKKIKKKKLKNKTKKSKKDHTYAVITYENGAIDEDFSDLRGSDDNSDSVDRFEDEVFNDGSHVHHKATSTRAPPKDHDHDLELAAGAATSMAVTFVESTNHYGDRFVLDDDDLRDYAAAAATDANDDDDKNNNNNGYLSSDGVFLSKQGREGYSRNTSQTLRESFRNVISSISPLHAKPTASPSQEAWQDRDGFHDELVVFHDNSGRRQPPTNNGEEDNNWDSDEEEEESVFVKVLNSNRHPNYRRNLLLGKQSRCCWCLVILIFVVFLAMLIPLAMLSHDKRESTNAQKQSQQQQQPVFSTGDTTPPPTLPNTTVAPTATSTCVDEIYLNHNQTCFNTNSLISFSFTHCTPNQYDWIALYPANSIYYERLWKDYMNWIWVCGNLPCTEEDMAEDVPLQGTFIAPATVPGSYQLFIVLDSRWPYRYAAATEVFRVAESCEGEEDDNNNNNNQGS